MSAPPEWKSNSTRNVVYLEAQRKAKDLDIPFALKLADVPLPAKCAVLGIPLELSKPKRHPHMPTIILIDPALGFIPRNIRVSEAPSYGAPITEFDSRSAGALAYAALAQEVLAR